MAENTKTRNVVTWFWMGLTVILVLVAAGFYLSKEMAVRKLTSEHEAQRQQWTEAARSALEEQAREMLRLSAIPLGWAIRTEMMKENYAQIDNYIQRFVKEPNVLRIVLADVEGKVLLATDKKLEGQAVAEVYPNGPVDSESPVVYDEGEGEILLVVPVMGLDARLGTLVVAYDRAVVESRARALEEAPAPTGD